MKLVALACVALSSLTANAGPVLTNDANRAIVSCGAEHALMLRTDGTVWAYGVDSFGQLGGAPKTMTNTFFTIPSRITNILGAVSVAAGDYHSLVLQYDGTVLVFGRNGNGQLGTGDTASRTIPTLLTNLSSVAGLDAGPDFSFALFSNATVKAWGNNAFGKLGIGSTTPSQVTSPTNVSGLSGARMISCGNNHALAVKTNGTVWAWGANGSGQLGDNSLTTRTAPVQISLTGVLEVAAGEDCSFARSLTNGRALPP